MDLTSAAAVLFALGCAVIVGFQVALALGAPWGAYAMGGTFPGRYSPTMRVAALVQAGLIALLALVVLSAAGLAVPALADALPWLIWVAVGISAIALLLNAITRSPGERRIWAPVAAVLLLSSLVVALTAT